MMSKLVLEGENRDFLFPISLKHTRSNLHPLHLANRRIFMIFFQLFFNPSEEFLCKIAYMRLVPFANLQAKRS